MYALQNLQSLAGIAVVIGVCWLISENRKRFPWKLAIGALLVQAALIGLFFGVGGSKVFFDGVGAAIESIKTSTQAGTGFVFGYLAGGASPYPLSDPKMAPMIFAFQVLPVILVICALSALLWHWRILKWITKLFGFLFQKTMGLRGPPGLAAAATIFMGQIEGPIFIRTYLEKLTRSELFMLLAVGMSCVSGSTMVAYVSILGASIPNVAAHVLTASLISAPAGILLARIIMPADPSEATEELDGGTDKTYESSIDALIKGTGDGLNVVLNVGATLIVFVALAALVNHILAAFPPVGGEPMSLERGLGAVFSPLAWCIGVPWGEAPTAGRLLGVKLILTEFTAFIQLSGMHELSERTRILMTYALCGFANIASVGINVAGFGVLVPSRRAEVMGMVWKAMLAGFLATCLTASVVGLMPPSLLGGH